MKPIPSQSRADASLKVLSIHWGFSVGGVATYSTLIEGIAGISELHVESVCILRKTRHVDTVSLSKLGHKRVIEIKSLFDLSWLWQLRDLLDSVKPALVMTHGFNGHFVAFILSFLARAPFRPVCSYHGQYHATTPARRFVGWIYDGFTEFYIRRRACATVTVAEFCKRYLVSKAIDPTRVEVIHNGAPDLPRNAAARANLREAWKVSDQEILLGIASRLDPVKGVTYLLDAFTAISSRHAHMKLVIIGTGAIEGELQSRVNSLGLANRVIFTGFRTDIADCLEAMDVFLLPSLAEYHSIALLEAMRAGKVIIATNVGGNTESVRHELEALIVPPADSAALAEAIERLIKDADLRGRLGRNARDRFFAEFTAERTVERTARWLERALG